MSGSVRGTYRQALAARDLRLLLLAFAVDRTGTWSYNVVLVVYVYNRTGSTLLIAVTTTCSWLPRLLLSTYAGVLADRYERTRLMLRSALAGFVVAVGLAVAVATNQDVALVLTLHALLAATTSFYEPAAQAVVPETVPDKDLPAANALFTVLESLVVVLGPAVGGLLLLLTHHPALGVELDALTFLVAALLVRALRVRSTGDGSTEGGGLLSQIGTGLAALRNEPVALVLVLYCALDTAVFGAMTVLYVPLSQLFGTGSNGYSYLLASQALGGVLAAGLVTRLATSRRLAPVIVGGMCLLALPNAATALVSSPTLGALLQVLSGIGMGIVDVIAITGLQRALPKAVLSRVFGVLETLILGGVLLASFGSSLLLAATSLRTALLVIGGGFAAVSVIGIGPLLRADRAAPAVLPSE